MKRMLDQKLIDFLNSLGDSLKYESSSNTFEIGTNLYVDGITNFDDKVNLSVLNIKQGLYDDDFDCVKISYSKDNERLQFDFTGWGVTYYLEPYASDGNIVTDDNVKTLFGNQSLVGSGNIDLYKHYLEFEVHVTSAPEEQGNYTCRILVQSSSNVDCTSTTGATQKLKDLLKCDSTNKYYESGIAGGSVGAQLYGNSRLLYVLVDGIAAEIKSINDRVETI